MSLAAVVSVLVHALLLSLAFSGDTVGLPGLSLPWQERRAQWPDLRVVLTPETVLSAGSDAGQAAEPLRPTALAPDTGLTLMQQPVPAIELAALPLRARELPTLGAFDRQAPAGAPSFTQPLPAAPAGQATLPVVSLPDSPGDDALASLATTAAALGALPLITATRSEVAIPAVTAALPLALPVADAASTPLLATPPLLVPVPVLVPVQAPASMPMPMPKPAPLPLPPPLPSPTAVEPDPTVLALIDEAARQAVQRETSAREAAIGEATARQEAQRREAESRATARQEAEREQAARQEALRQDVLRQEADRQEASRQEQARQEGLKQEAFRQETMRQEVARRDVERREGERREAERNEAARAEGARQEAARLEAARQDAARLEAARQDAARQEAVLQEAARQTAGREEAARQVAARAEALRNEAARVEAARLEARLAMGRQLNEEADRRQAAAAAAAGQDPRLPLSLSSARRGRLFGRADANAELVLYAEAWARKIQLNTAVDTVRDAAQRSHVDPVVTVAIRSDGSVESISFVRSSGVPDIDAAVRRIVQGQLPYTAFPPALAREFDVIEIRRTWRFDSAVRLY